MTMKALALGLLASSVVGQVVPGALLDTTSCRDKMAALFGEDRIVNDLRSGHVAAHNYVDQELDAVCGRGQGEAARKSVLALYGPVSTLQSLEVSSRTEAPQITDKVEPPIGTLVSLFEPSPSLVEQNVSPSNTASSMAGQCKVRMSYATKDEYAARQVCGGLADAKDSVKLWLDEICKKSDIDEACYELNIVPDSPNANRV